MTRECIPLRSVGRRVSLLQNYFKIFRSLCRSGCSHDLVVEAGYNKQKQFLYHVKTVHLGPFLGAVAWLANRPGDGAVTNTQAGRPNCPKQLWYDQGESR